MFEKKQKVLIFGGAVIAVLFLIFGLIFLKLDIKESEIDPVQVNTELIAYEEYVHRCGFSGTFETDAERFGEQLSSLYPNININAYDENTISFLNDLTIVIIDDKTVEIIATQTNQKKTVQITTNDEGTFIHTLDFECEHRYKVVQDDRNNCVDNGVQYCQCELCGQSFTAIFFATGHVFEGEGCLAVCTVCKASKEDPEHVFQEQRMTGEYVAKYGTCSVKTQYFYSCLYCDKMGEKIFDGNYEDKHRPANKPTVSKINNSTAYYTLSCLDCAAELLNARITSITDPTTNNISLSIETEANVEYSLDNKNFSKNYPIFDTTGTYILYYQITDGRYTMKDSIRIQWTNIERIDVDFVPDTAKDNPYIIYDNIVLTGTAVDTQGISSFTINNAPVNVDEAGRWQYELKINPGEIKELTFILTDTYYNQTAVTHYFYRYGNEDVVRFMPTIHANSNIAGISGKIDDFSKLSSFLVDGVEVVISKDGVWSKNFTVNNCVDKRVSAIATYQDGKIVKYIYTLCSIHNLPSVNLSSLSGDILTGTITDNNSLTCSAIETVSVYYLDNLDGFVLNQQMIANTITNGYLVYDNDNENNKDLGFSIDLDKYRNIETIAIEVTTSHGHQVLYRFRLGWKYNKLISLSVEIVNIKTDKTQTMTINLDTLQAAK